MRITPMNYILSPCGTSILTNLASNEERKLVFNYANVKHFDEIPNEDKAVLNKLIEKAKHEIAQADINAAIKMSAELNGIITYYQQDLKQNGDYHLLLCTDTWLGEQTAELVKLWLIEKGFTVEIKRQTDLQTKDLMAFQCALSDLVKWCEDVVLNYQKSCYKIIFNLTGGFKSVQGFLQTLAIFYADESIYIFETSSELLRIPRLPVELSALPVIEKNITLFRRLAMNLDIKSFNISDIPETLLLNITDEWTLSPWGEMLWQKSKKEIYGKQLQPSPSKKIKFADSFYDSVQNIAKDRLCLVNEKIDLLAQYLEKGIEMNSLDFKPVRGDARKPSTHEMNAWADQDAKRLFGHYENSVFILDRLDKKLNG
jgi:putative CRISPR-associated protein (TIGR02619 family)